MASISNKCKWFVQKSNEDFNKEITQYQCKHKNNLPFLCCHPTAIFLLDMIMVIRWDCMWYLKMITGMHDLVRNWYSISDTVSLSVFCKISFIWHTYLDRKCSIHWTENKSERFNWMTKSGSRGQGNNERGRV